MSTTIDTDNLTYDDALAIVREAAAEATAAYGNGRPRLDEGGRADPVSANYRAEQWGAKKALDALVERMEEARGAQ